MALAVDAGTMVESKRDNSKTVSLTATAARSSRTVQCLKECGRKDGDTVKVKKWVLMVHVEVANGITITKYNEYF
jgi:hypothetical protein